MHPSYPDWEKKVKFNPRSTLPHIRKHPTWITLDGDKPATAVHYSTVDYLNSSEEHNIRHLPIRNPDNFVSGGINQNSREWLDQFKDDLPPHIKDWITKGVDVEDFFRHFKGNFKGKSYDGEIPPKTYFHNSSSCRSFLHFIENEITEKLNSGSVRPWGKLGECELPHLIMPLTVEPSKPRLCHDERFLNLWINDNPFQLENLKHVPRMVSKSARMIVTDDKSGYEHVKLTQQSETYFGFQFGGWVFSYTVLPFGWKASAIIYQTIGMQITSFLRKLDVLTLQYIDDRLVIASDKPDLPHGNINTISFALVELLSRLGYTLSVKKSKLNPSETVKFLGFFVDSKQMCFHLPLDKKQTFISLREFIFKSEKVTVKTLQRFAGKCVSMNLVIRAAKLYCREVNAAISIGIKNSRDIHITGDLRKEIEHWRFLDHWQGVSPWRFELQKQITIATDASLFKYGISVLTGEQQGLQFGDFWENCDDRPIHLKEADAIIKAIKSLGLSVRNHRLDILTDNQSVIAVWENQGGRDKLLNDIMKDLFKLVCENNIDLHLQYISSSLNVADAPSRLLSLSDSKLSAESWSRVEERYGPHTVDLMSLDSNVMMTTSGQKLKHFTPAPSPLSAGVNLFAQNIHLESNPYVNPPINIIFPVLSFLKEQRVEKCTFIAPLLDQAPIWLPFLKYYSVSSFVLGVKGQKGIIEVPSRKGFILDNRGLMWPLVVYRLSFVQ